MENPHIVVIPGVGLTHLIPIAEFSKLLLHHHPEFHVTIFIPCLESPPNSSKTYLQSLPSTIKFNFLPSIRKDQIARNIHIAQQIQLTVTLSLPHIHQELKSLCSRTRVVALIVDVFAHQALDFASELNLLSYVYLPLSSMILSFYFYAPKLDQILGSNDLDTDDPIVIPGCVGVQYRDLPTPCHDRSSVAYKEFLDRAKRISSLPDGVLVNSFLELESGTIRALQEHVAGGKPKIYQVGPIIQSGSIDQENGKECLTWLDNQEEPNSVLYVSFGSGGTLSQDQFNELALGLELSGEKFLWVLRAPSDTASSTYLGSAFEDPLKFLPDGFLERIKNKNQGLVVPFWAPQIQILGHSAIGGFLSHCGWNSILESVVNGVPIIAYPLFAEQSLNAVLVSDGLKVALRLRGDDDDDESGIVGRDGIAMAVRDLMMGVREDIIDIRKRMEQMKIDASNSLKEDGSSRMALSELAKNLRSFKQ